MTNQEEYDRFPAEKRFVVASVEVDGDLEWAVFDRMQMTRREGLPFTWGHYAKFESEESANDAAEILTEEWLKEAADRKHQVCW